SARNALKKLIDHFHQPLLMCRYQQNLGLETGFGSLKCSFSALGCRVRQQAKYRQQGKQNQ
ncbi:MAG: hypothetical protein WB542_16955, partial [Polaromonas sp.]